MVKTLSLLKKAVSVKLAHPLLKESFQLSDCILSAPRVQVRLQRLKNAFLKIDFTSLGGWFEQAAMLPRYILVNVPTALQLTLVCIICIYCYSLMHLKVEPQLYLKTSRRAKKIQSCFWTGYAAGSRTHAGVASFRLGALQIRSKSLAQQRANFENLLWSVNWECNNVSVSH